MSPSPIPIVIYGTCNWARLLLDEAYGEMLRLEQDAYYVDTAGMKESMINPGRPGI